MRNVKAEQEWSKRMVRVAEMVAMLDDGKGAKALEGGHIDSVRVLLPGERRADVLLVVKASVGTAQWVGFVGAMNLATAMLTWRQKELARGIVFREDQPWGGEAAKGL